MKYFEFLSLVVCMPILFSGCKFDQVSEIDEPVKQHEARPSAETDAEDEAKPLILQNYGIKAIHFQNEIWPWLAFEISPNVDFVEWQACIVDRKEPFCDGGELVTNSHVIVNLPEGVLNIKVRPCAREAKDTRLEKECAKWQSKPFLQRKQLRERLNVLLDQRSKKAQVVRNLGLEVYNALLSYKEVIKECQKEAIKKMIPEKVYEKLLGWGPDRIGVGLLDPDASMVLEADNQRIITSDLGQLNDNAKVSQPKDIVTGKKEKQNPRASDGDELHAKLSFVAGALAVITPAALRIGEKLMAKKTKEIGGKILAEPKAEDFQTNPRKANAQKWGRRIMLGMGVAALAGLLIYAIKNSDDSLGEIGKEYIKDVFNLSDSACATASEAVNHIVEINEKARIYRNELNAIELEIDVEVERGKKL